MREFKITTNNSIIESREFLNQSIQVIRIRFESSNEISFSSNNSFFIFPTDKMAISLSIKSQSIEVFSNELMLLENDSYLKIKPLDMYGALAIFVIRQEAIDKLTKFCRDLKTTSTKQALTKTKKVNLNIWMQECLHRYLFELITDKYHILGIKEFLEIEILKELVFHIQRIEGLQTKDEFYPSPYFLKKVPIQLRKGIEFIEKKPIDKLTVKELCQYSGAAQSTLCRMFKKYLNTTAQQFIQKRKMVLSKDLLFNENKSILEISELLGFSHPSAFIFTFKKHFGQTPNQFRKKLDL